MWHVCEEAYAQGIDHWQPLLDYAMRLAAHYRIDQEHVNKWYNVCLQQFPVYLDHWADNPEAVDRTPLLAEKHFSIDYKLPSGRSVRLRGKWDSVDLLDERAMGLGKRVWLQENKVKGDVDVNALHRQLKFDLQTMIYLVALHEARYTPELNAVIPKGSMIAGVRYNVIRRPLSGGKGSIVQHKPSKSNPQGETFESYMERLGAIIRENRGEFFYRWASEVSPSNLMKFRETFLNPVLENILDDYEWWDWCKMNNGNPFQGELRRNVFPTHTPRHYRYPFGVYNPMDEGGCTDVDAYLETGSEVGLERITDLFPEL